VKFFVINRWFITQNSCTLCSSRWNYFKLWLLIRLWLRLLWTLGVVEEVAVVEAVVEALFVVVEV
jgi:hypothetical protein